MRKIFSAHMRLSGMILVLAAGFFSSCGTTRNAAFIPFDKIVADHEYLEAADALEEAATGEDAEELYRADKDEVLRYLDTGVLYHIAGEPKKSIERLTEAEILIEDNYTRSISDAAASFLLNDYSLVYFGEAYEDIYLNVFKALDYLKLNDFDGAYVEIRRVGEKLNLLEDKYGRIADSINESEDSAGAVPKGEIEFHNSALARYISMLLYRADRNVDSAAIDLAQLKRAFEDQPAIYDFGLPKNLDDMLTPTSQARINIMAFAGPGPEKRASALRVTARGGLILITQETEDNSGNMKLTDLTPIAFPVPGPGLNFKVETPVMSARHSRVTRIQALVDGKPAGDLSLLEKMDRVAMETFKLNETIILVRTVIRAVLTTAVTGTAKGVANDLTKDSELGSLLSFVGGIALDVAADIKEEADLRLARYFPAKAYAGEFLVAPGEHDVAIEFYNAAGDVIYTEEIPPREYAAGKLNLVTAYDLE
ncbi:MAG: hypothetical protein LBQ57_02600 [Spirochaetales bacterium]|jgi:hypothetical protein|nr:hypothetical protein [Spirochaetales bacterium]